MKLGEEFYLEYVEITNEENGFDVAPEHRKYIAQIAQFFGEDSYRPISRLLLQNWNELSLRVEKYTEEEWKIPRSIAEESASILSPLAVAIFLEVMEGEDTSMQNQLTAAVSDLDIEQYIKSRQREKERLEVAMKVVK